MANGSPNFVQDYYITAPASGVPVVVDSFGTFFNCFQATTGFQMSFDGSSFFDWNFGLAAQFQTEFTRLWFRSTNGLDNDIAFYAGNVEVINNQLNVISDSGSILAVSNRLPLTYLNPQNFAIAAGATVVIPGVNNGKQRKDIYVFNLDSNLTLSVGNLAGVLGAVVYPLDNLVLETSDTVTIANQNGAAVNVMVMEVYYAS